MELELAVIITTGLMRNLGSHVSRRPLIVRRLPASVRVFLHVLRLSLSVSSCLRLDLVDILQLTEILPSNIPR